MTKAILIDDNQTNVLVLLQSLERNNIAVKTILPQRDTTIDTLIEQIQQTENFDIIITDISLPIGDGYKLLQKIREKNLTVPVIVYSAQHEQLAQVREAGFNGFIGKPIKPDTIASTIQRVLAGEKVWNI